MFFELTNKNQSIVCIITYYSKISTILLVSRYLDSIRYYST